MKNPENHHEFLRVPLTRDELLALGKKQSDKLRDFAQAEQELVSIKSGFKSRMEAITADVQHCTRLISDGFEMREVECYTFLNCPIEGKASIFRGDTHELVRDRKMTDDERQMKLEEQPEAAE